MFTGCDEPAAAHLEMSPREWFARARQFCRDVEVGEEGEMCQRVYALAREQAV